MFRLIKERSKKIIASRKPDEEITSQEQLYLERWYLIPKNRYLQIYLHRFSRPDQDMELHDHPWANVSLLLDGSYVEELPISRTKPWIDSYKILRNEGAMVMRRPSASHRIDSLVTETVTTLFITGPKVREWGFWEDKNWTHWSVFCRRSGRGL